MGEYEYPLINDDGKIICQLCGKPFLVISPKHLVNHKITYSEYKLRFPNAPLSSAEFDSRSKYGKEKGIFQDDEPEKLIIGDEKFVDEEPEIEEVLDLQNIINSEKRNKIDNSKHKILDHLRMYFSNIKMNYSIRENWPDGRTIFQFITDFADPILKIDIEFPKTFWHNQEQFIDLNRNKKLEEHGWKVVEINSPSPSFKEIDEVLNNL